MQIEEDIQVEDPVYLAWIAQGGDRVESAMASLHRRYQSRFIAYLRKNFNKLAKEHEDITQEAWIKIFKTAKRGYMPNEPKAWFIEILRNTAIDTWRKDSKKSAFEPLDPETPDGETDLDENFADIAQMSDIMNCYERALDALAKSHPSDSELITQIVIEERDQGDLARRLGIGYGALRQRFTTSKKRLLQYIAELCPDYLSPA